MVRIHADFVVAQVHDFIQWSKINLMAKPISYSVGIYSSYISPANDTITSGARRGSPIPAFVNTPPFELSFESLDIIYCPVCEDKLHHAPFCKGFQILGS